MRESTTTTTTTDITPQEIIADLKELLLVLRRGWRLIALCCVMCLALAVVYLAGANRVYRATARLLVLQNGGRPLNMANNDPNRLLEGNDDYIPTHTQIIISPLVIMRAIDKVGIENLPTLLAVKQAGKDPIKKAIDLLKVTRPDRSARVLKVDYEAGSRKEATLMLQAITASYKDFLDSTLQHNTKGIIDLIEKARSQLKDELQKKEEEYREFRKKSMVLAANETGRTFLAQRLEQSDKALNEAHQKALNLTNQLELGRKLASQGSALWAIAHAISQLGGDSNSLIANVSSTTSQFGATDYVRHLVQEQQQLAERYGVENAKAKELQQQITRIQERSRNSRTELEHVEIEDLLGSISQSLKSVQAVELELGKRFAAVQEEARGIEISLIDESILRNDVERQRSLFNTVVDQLKQASFSQDFNSINSEIIEPVNALKDPVWPRINMTLALALVAGGVLGIGVTLVANWMDQRIRTLAELRQVLDYTVLGQIFQLTEEQGAGLAEFGLITQAMPRSIWAEAYRSTRTNIDFLRRSRNIQVIQVTSPYSGDGKSASASNLAISFANAGRKVLLIDADLRKPSLHKVFGRSKERGFSPVLKGALALSEAIQPTTIKGLDLITAGDEPANPAELLASERFAAALEQVRAMYDLVIIDTSPILAVTDPAIIGALVDGVVLVVQPSSLKRRDVEHTKELLKTLGTAVLGTLINRLGRDDSSGYYGYGYGYGYGSTGHEPAETEAPVPVPAVLSAAEHKNGLAEHPASGNGHASSKGPRELES
jgi:capsular exopolysaccharide synthesis family protein